MDIVGGYEEKIAPNDQDLDCRNCIAGIEAGTKYVVIQGEEYCQDCARDLFGIIVD